MLSAELVTVAKHELVACHCSSGQCSSDYCCKCAEVIILTTGIWAHMLIILS